MTACSQGAGPSPGRQGRRVPRHRFAATALTACRRPGWRPTSDQAPMSGTAPFATDQATRFSRMLWRKHGPFSSGGVYAILPQCPGTDLHCVIAPHSANCRPIFMSCPVRGRALAGRSNMMFRRGLCSTIGPRAWRSRTPKSTSLTLGSAIFSTSYLDHADELRRHLP